MSTRSEIRFFLGKKLEGCVYHHHDGYPEHIVCSDLKVLTGLSNNVKVMKVLATNHGTKDPNCGHKTIRQGDLEYDYEVQEENKGGKVMYNRPISKVKITHIGSDEGARVIFNGTMEEAEKKFCRKGE